jgi:hypothetical protein
MVGTTKSKASDTCKVEELQSSAKKRKGHKEKVKFKIFTHKQIEEPMRM